MPGTDAQKGQLLNCVGCHTLSRPLNSKYSADDFLTMILPRMQSYVNQSIPMHPQLRHAERRMEEQGDQRVQVYRPRPNISPASTSVHDRNGISN